MPELLKDKFTSLNICVIGDLILDEYIIGKVTRVSPEAPIPVVDQQAREYKPGGAANVALNLINLGVNTYLAGVVGDDTHGLILKKLIEEVLPEKGQGIITLKGRITTTKTRVVAHNQHVVRIDHEEHTDIGNDVSAQLMDYIADIHKSNKLDAVILQDYEKGMLHHANIPAFIEFLNECGIRIIVDPKDKNFWMYRHVHLFKPNRKEAEKAIGKKIPMTEDALADAALLLESRLHNEVTVITLSEYGIYIKDAENKVWRHSEVMEVIDVCGAGDAVIGIVAAAYCAGLPMPQIALLGNIAGGIVCGERGVVAVSLDRLQKAYNNMSL